jgi:hypothetical protein
MKPKLAAETGSRPSAETGNRLFARLLPLLAGFLLLLPARQ